MMTQTTGRQGQAVLPAVPVHALLLSLPVPEQNSRCGSLSESGGSTPGSSSLHEAAKRAGILRWHGLTSQNDETYMNDLMPGATSLTLSPEAISLENGSLPTAGGCATIGTRVLSSCTAAAGLSWSGICFRYATATGAAIALLAESAQEHARGATGTGPHTDSVYRTVDGAGATLNTGVLINDERLVALYPEHFMWTDHRAHTATDAGFHIESQGNNMFQVPQHFRSF